MAFIPLNRTFLPITAQGAVTADELEIWGRRAYGAKTWPDLLSHKRVVILAEANSGKTQEFRHQVAALREAESSAFFVAIEALARKNFRSLLAPGDRSAFDSWKAGTQPGWFFLDSVDEARLTGQSFTEALGHLSEALDGALERASVVISSRGTDWHGEVDLKQIRDFLPLPPEPVELENPDEALLSTLNKEFRAKAKEVEKDPTDIHVYTMSPLTLEQRSAFLVGRGLTDGAAFESALFQQGLRPLAERPGDLNLLVVYWKTNRRFGGLGAMTEHAVTERLRERTDRLAPDILSVAKARDGAERLASALTLSKKLSIWTGDLEDKDEESLDPFSVLSDFSGDECRALLSRGLFAPAAFGRIRFHHRSAIEYLTAQWFKGLLLKGRLSETGLLALFTSAPFGVATVPPSLRPAAAWLAHDALLLQDFVVANDPLLLIAHGDPKSLPIPTREKLLLAYARLDAAGEISDFLVDEHSLWMFGDDRLAPAIKAAWQANAGREFQFEILRLIDRAAIKGCEDLAGDIALDPAAYRYSRIVAARVLKTLGDKARLGQLAAAMLAKPGDFNAKIAPELALCLYPDVLTTDQLLFLIAKTKPAASYQVEGFGFSLQSLYEACPNAVERQALLAGLVVLGFSRPHQPSEPISSKHRQLLKRLAPLIRRAIVQSDADGVTTKLAELVSLGELASLDDYDRDEPPVGDLVKSRTDLNQMLFWIDVAHGLRKWPEEKRNPTVWVAQAMRRRFWSLSLDDADWLLVGLATRKVAAERRVALSALVSIYSEEPDAAARLDDLANQVAADKVLSADLTRHRAPPVKSTSMLAWENREKQQDRVEQVRHDAAAERLKALREQVAADPALLSDPKRLAAWPGPWELFRVTEWLAKRADQDMYHAPANTELLSPAFPPAVIEAYASGMKTMWRTTCPARPEWTEKGRTENRTNILAIGGVNLEARTANGLASLGAAQVEQAVRHICLSDADIPEWLSPLLSARPAIVAPIVLAEIQREWGRADGTYTPYLYRASTYEMVPQLRAGLWALITGPESPHRNRVETITTLLRRIVMQPAERAQMLTLVLERLALKRADDSWAWTIVYLGLLFELDAEVAVEQLQKQLLAQPARQRGKRAESAFAVLFGMSRGSVMGLEAAPTEVLRELVRLAYAYIRPKDDKRREGSFSPDTRDDAESGRNRVLSALLQKVEEAGYRAMMALAVSPETVNSTHRFLQLARGLAEKAAERQAWTETDFASFAADNLTPIRTSDELLEFTLGVLDDLVAEMKSGDSSPRAALASAPDEDAVQQWLIHHFNKIAQHRFTASRETEIAGAARPDVLLTAAQTGDEVAIEVKHGGKKWTPLDLEHALTGQLADDYLTIPNRRRGLFVMSNHSARTWVDDDPASPTEGQSLTFAEIIARLSRQAEGLISNSTGFIRVAVRGLDFMDPAIDRPKETRRDAVKRIKAERKAANHIDREI